MANSKQAAFPAGSPECATIVRLGQLGGRGHVKAIMPAMWSGFQSTTRFHDRVGKPLLDAGLVTLAGADYVLTRAGWAFARQQAGGQPAGLVSLGDGSKVAALMRNAGTMRPGALGYRGIPSLMGGKRIPFHGKADDDV